MHFSDTESLKSVVICVGESKQRGICDYKVKRSYLPKRICTLLCHSIASVLSKLSGLYPYCPNALLTYLGYIWPIA